MVTGMPEGIVGALFLLLQYLVNLGFFVFNILPIPPLDGSRVLYALAPEFVRRGMEVIERYGLILVFTIVLVGESTYWIVYEWRQLGFFIDVFSGSL